MGADLYRQKQKHYICGFERSEDAINKGYFRDAYNNGSILQKFGLSWWQDVMPLCDKKGTMSFKNVIKFKSMLNDREAMFENNIGMESKEGQEYFREGAVLLKKYLDDTITREVGLECSL